MTWVVVLLCYIALNLERSIIHMIQSRLHGTVLQSPLNIMPMDIVIQCSTKRGVGIFFKSLTWYFYLKILLPHTYNDSHSLVICLLMQVVPAYMGLPHLFHVLCMFYVTTHTTEFGVLLKERGPL